MGTSCTARRSAVWWTVHAANTAPSAWYRKHADCRAVLASLCQSIPSAGPPALTVHTAKHQCDGGVGQGGCNCGVQGKGEKPMHRQASQRPGAVTASGRRAYCAASVSPSSRAAHALSVHHSNTSSAIVGKAFQAKGGIRPPGASPASDAGPAVLGMRGAQRRHSVRQGPEPRGSAGSSPPMEETHQALSRFFTCSSRSSIRYQ